MLLIGYCLPASSQIVDSIKPISISNEQLKHIIDSLSNKAQNSSQEKLIKKIKISIVDNEKKNSTVIKYKIKKIPYHVGHIIVYDAYGSTCSMVADFPISGSSGSICFDHHVLETNNYIYEVYVDGNIVKTGFGNKFYEGLPPDKTIVRKRNPEMN